MLCFSVRRGLGLLAVAWSGFALSATANTIVSGHLDHPKAREVAVWIGQVPLSDKPQLVVKSALDAKGDFRLELPDLGSPTQATLAHGNIRTPLFLTPGDKLQVTYDVPKHRQTLAFAGTKTAAAASAFLSEFELKFPESKRLTTEGQQVSAVQFQVLADAYRLQQLAFLQAYAAAHPLTPAFRAHVRQGAAYQLATRLLYFHPKYVPWHWYGEAAKEKAPATYDAWLEKIKPSQDSALATNNPEYLTFLKTFALLHVVQPAADPTAEQVVAQVTQQFGTGPSRELALALYLGDFFLDKSSILRQWGGQYSATKVTALMTAYKALARDAALARTVSSLYEGRLPLVVGQVAPPIRLWDDQGNVVTLASFKGKVVYLDFWASSCGPCISQVPQAKKLGKRFEGKDVVFISVSSDDNAPWKKALAKHSLRSPNSVHLRDSIMHRVYGIQHPAASTAYHIDYVPTYFIIGRDGRLLDVDAPRPDSGEQAVQALEAALNDTGKRPKRH